MTRIPLILSLLALLPASALAQNTWFVPDDFPTIQAGIDGVQNGDTVIVRDGTYFELINFNGKAVVLTSENGSSATTINGNQVGTVVTFDSGEGSGTVLQGFTVANGSSYNGGGIYCANSSPTLANCTITDNEVYSHGGGMYCTGTSSPVLNSCRFDNNNAANMLGSDGGGIYCGSGSSPTLNKCIFFSNDAASDGGGMYCSGSSSPTLNNCTFAFNFTVYGGGGGILGSQGCRLLNCIVWDNWPIDISGSLNGATYSCIQSGHGNSWFGVGCIDSNPRFANPSNGNVYLKASSPCIDTGDPASSLDPDGTKADMGAFYYDQRSPILSVSNLVAGQQALAEVHYARPNNYCHFAWSIHGGGPTPTPWGDALVTAPFHVKIMPTDAIGYASYTANIPLHAAGVTVWCHGTDAGTQSMLNALMLVIQ